MSYSISLIRGKSKSKINDIKCSEMPIGGTYRVPFNLDERVDENSLDLNVTWNYAWYFYQTIDKEKGIRKIYGMKGKDAVKLMESALPKLDEMIEQERKTGKVLSETWGKGGKYDEDDKNYWSTSARNAKRALEGLIFLGNVAPYFTFTGD